MDGRRGGEWGSRKVRRTLWVPLTGRMKASAVNSDAAARQNSAYSPPCSVAMRPLRLRSGLAILRAICGSATRTQTLSLPGRGLGRLLLRKLRLNQWVRCPEHEQGTDDDEQC